MIEFLSANLAPVMFGTMVLFFLLGFPIAFALAALGILFGLIGIELGLLSPSLFIAIPERLYGVIANDTLLAIPFFTFMGLILERSGMAEDLLDSVGQVFGPLRGGIAYAVIFVGALLAATTGIVAASVISMGLISLPIMLRYGYDRRLAAGVITASGTLAQIIPPSLVLIVMADALSVSVGDLYRAAFLPGLLLVGLYVLYVFACTILRPESAPAIPVEARGEREPNGASGHISLLLLVVCASLAGTFVAKYFFGGRPTDEMLVIGMSAGAIFALGAAIINKATGVHLLSSLAQRVTFAMVPPLALVFLVLGSIFIGIATPTEGGAMGAAGGVLLAMARRRLPLANLKQALLATAKLTTFVMFIVIGARMFSLTFYAINGHLWVEHMFSHLPGGQLGFLLVTMALIFVLAFFLDFFEIAFIVVPLIAVVAKKMGVDLIWLGVLLGVNLQTSFLHPPFGMALFFLRSVAPNAEYKDPVTSKMIAGVTTAQIYRGAIPFLVLQLCTVALLIAAPGLVRVGQEVKQDVDAKSVEDSMRMMELNQMQEAPAPDAGVGKKD